jgi:hypothetical protein
MHRVIRCALGVLTSGILFLTAGLAQQAAAPQPVPSQEGVVPVSHVERFNGDTTLPLKGGQSRALHVIVEDWGIHGRQRIEKFPQEGFLLVHLLAGKVTTVINGKEQAHNGGEYWIVPVGSSMSVQVTSESASLQTLSVRKN